MRTVIPDFKWPCCPNCVAEIVVRVVWYDYDVDCYVAYCPECTKQSKEKDNVLDAARSFVEEYCCNE